MGGRSGFQYRTLLAYCERVGIEGGDVEDLIDRIKIIENNVLVADAERAKLKEK